MGSTSIDHLIWSDSRANFATSSRYEPDWREARQRGLDYRQNSVSNWRRGVHAAPRELPTLVEELYDLSAQEWIDLGLAFAYGQRIRRRDLRDLHESRTRYRRFFFEEEGQSYAAKTLED